MKLSDLSNNAKAGIAAGCLVLALIIMYFTVFPDLFGGSAGFSGDDKVYLLCTNPKCNEEFEMTQAEFQKMMQASGGMPGPMMMMGPTAYTCKKCSQKTLYIATKCPNPKCGILFIPPNPMMGGQMNNDYPDRCPECKFSQMEQDAKNPPKQ